MATEMNDTDLLVELAEGDLVAIEAKYHFACLSLNIKTLIAHMFAVVQIHHYQRKP